MLNEYYFFYQLLRKRHPIQMEGSWLISKSKDIKHILNNPDTFTSERMDNLFAGLLPSRKVNFVQEHLSKWILHKDGNVKEVKTIISQQIYSYFRTKLNTALEYKVDLCKSQLTNLTNFDFREIVAIPVVTYLMMDMLDVQCLPDPTVQEKLLFKHMQNLAVMITRLNYSEEDIPELAKSLLYVSKLGKSFDGSHDTFLDEEYDEVFDEITIQRGLIFHAFVHDTTNLLCNSFYVLSQNRDKFNLDELDIALDEAIRLEPPVQAVVRTATMDTIVDGQSIKQGDTLTLFIASANRDEIEAPNEFLLGRKMRLFSFGHGVHACIGQPLAKAIGKEVLKSFLDKEQFQIQDVVWDNHSRTYRNMESLNVKANYLETINS